MTLIDVEGADHLDANRFILKGWSVPVNFPAIVAGRVRGLAWYHNTHYDNVIMTKVLPSTYPSVVVGIGFRFEPSDLFGGTTVNLPVFQLQTPTGGAIASVQTEGTGKLEVLNAAGSVVAVGSTFIAMSTWYFCELKLIIGAAGTCELHLNGVPGEIAPTVSNFGTANFGRFQVRQAQNQPGCKYDDLYIQDLTGAAPNNDFLGDVTVETLLPTADGTHQAWTPTPAGTHFSTVNNNPPDDDTSYVSDLTAGDLESYTVNPLALVSGQVYGVVTNLYARKDDAAGRQLAPLIRTGGVDYVGNTTPGLGSTYLFFRQVFQSNPAGGAWTIASVNGAEYGMKEIL